MYCMLSTSNLFMLRLLTIDVCLSLAVFPGFLYTSHSGSIECTNFSLQYLQTLFLLLQMNIHVLFKFSFCVLFVSTGCAGPYFPIMFSHVPFQLALMFEMFFAIDYRPGTVNSKSFVGQVLLRIKWKFKLTVHFKHEMIRKLFIKTSQKLWIKWNFELTVFELTVPNLYVHV